MIRPMPKYRLNCKSHVTTEKITLLEYFEYWQKKKTQSSNKRIVRDKGRAGNRVTTYGGDAICRAFTGLSIDIQTAKLDPYPLLLPVLESATLTELAASR